VEGLMLGVSSGQRETRGLIRRIPAVVWTRLGHWMRAQATATQRFLVVT
jgi:hypothetical protein